MAKRGQATLKNLRVIHFSEINLNKNLSTPKKALSEPSYHSSNSPQSTPKTHYEI